MTFYVHLKNSITGTGEDGDGQPVEIWEVTATPLSAESAASLRGTLRVDVSSMTYVPAGDGNWWREIAFSGAKPPVRHSYGDYVDANASGVGSVQSQVLLGPDEEFPREEFEIYFWFDDGWPFEYRRGGFIVEYEADAELLYESVNFYGNPSAWMYGTAEGDVSLSFHSAISAGLGMTSFKVYTPGDGAPQEPFWTELVGCAELA